MGKKVKGKKSKKEKSVESTAPDRVPKNAEAGAAEVVRHTAYEVHFKYEDMNGKRYDQTSMVADCRNELDAVEAVRNSCVKRGLDLEKLEIVDVKDRPDVQSEAGIELNGGLFMDDPEKPEEKETVYFRQVCFNGKIADVSVKNGDTRQLRVVIYVTHDIPRVSSEILSTFKGNEFLNVTIEPIQINALSAMRPNKARQDTTATPTKEIENPPVEAEMEDYVCPHCVNPMQAPKGTTQKDLKCDSCGREFPINFDTPIPEQDDSLFENGNGESPKAN